MEKVYQTDFINLPWKYWSIAYLKIGISISSQSAIEVINKTIKRALSDTYDKIVQEKVTRDLGLNFWQLIHIYNCCRKDTTTEEILRHAKDNYNFIVWWKGGICNWEFKEVTPREKLI